MQLLDKTMPTPEENLALDEALLELAEEGGLNEEVLRLWEPAENFVVLGRSSKINEETELEYCKHEGVSIFRRVSGGASIVTGPGCLMYGLLLSYQLRPGLRMLDQAHNFVMSGMKKAFSQLGIDASFQGTCDLTIANRKFSGNSLRCKRDWMMYHGTILYNFDLQLISNCLKQPPRQPDYRNSREHSLFVGNLSARLTDIKTALVDAWQVKSDFPFKRPAIMDELIEQKYANENWTYAR